MRTPHRALSTLQLEDEATSWARAMGERYGPGNYQLFRSLYKDLCDEMRNESETRPPPPFLPEGSSIFSASPSRPADDAGAWGVAYDRATNIVRFTRAAVAATRQARVVAYAPVEVKNPPKISAALTFVDWYPLEVLITRHGVVLHFSIACNEGGMHMRNLRAYDAAASPLLWGTTDHARWLRELFFYDGPSLWHLELDFLNELYDTMQDHGVTLNWVRWAARWVFYLEHVNYTRWSLGILEELIPAADQGPEEDFLLEKERALLQEPAEDPLSGRSL
ncbi:unnamed protein product [Phytomonas sp. Hart1]|nr:unnamed protein product [Phytomonas sp. Hart1]|eukprot:CCW69242.1 unnamed protein product [Phytomonas sp. isolate Hart1]